MSKDVIGLKKRVRKSLSDRLFLISIDIANHIKIVYNRKKRNREVLLKSSSFEDKLWKFAETFAKTMNNSAQKKERDLDRRFENGTISDEDYWEQSKKAINTQVDAADILERCRNRNNNK